MVSKKTNSLVANSTEGLNKKDCVNNASYTELSTLKCASLCAGISADKEAMKNLSINHRTLYTIEIDAKAREVYELNHGKPEKSYEDIIKVNPKKLANVDFMMISIPCQNYSTQNCNRNKICDSKNNLWESAIDILSHSNAKHFIFENVPGLLSIDDGKVFQNILEKFKNLNYNIKYEVLNAKNYGSCQSRKRLYVVGTRKDLKKEFFFPQPQAVSACVNDVIKKGDYSAQLYDASKCIPFIEKRDTGIKKLFLLPHIKYASDARIVSTSGLAPTIVASSAYTKYYDEKNKLFRYLTNKELASIMGFENFKFSTKKMKTKQLIGNSIDVKVLEAIFKNMFPDRFFRKNSVDLSLEEAA